MVFVVLGVPEAYIRTTSKIDVFLTEVHQKLIDLGPQPRGAPEALDTLIR